MADGAVLLPPAPAGQVPGQPPPPPPPLYLLLDLEDKGDGTGRGRGGVLFPFNPTLVMFVAQRLFFF